MYLLIGSNELDMSGWIWRVSTFSNFFATLINIHYITHEDMTDLYYLHLFNSVSIFIWWLFFVAILWKSPGFVTDNPSNPYDAALDIIGSGRVTDQSLPNYPNVCHTCRVVKPLRSKHCKVMIIPVISIYLSLVCTQMYPQIRPLLVSNSLLFIIL